MDEKLITYAVPYYFGIGYLRLALQSLIDQENPHWLALDREGALVVARRGKNNNTS